MDDRSKHGRFRVECELWVTTTVSAHRVLKKLDKSDGPVPQSELVDLLGESRAKSALNLLQRKGWAIGKPIAHGWETSQGWEATPSGRAHLQRIEDEAKEIDTGLREWIERQGVAGRNVAAVAGNLRRAIRTVVRDPRFRPRNASELLTRAKKGRRSPLRELFATAGREVRSRTPCPVASLLCREAIERILVEFHESVPPEPKRPRKLSILLDTNVLARLTCAESEAYAELSKVLDRVASAYDTVLYVTSRTLEEAKRLLATGGWLIQAAATPAREGGPDVRKRALRNPFVVLYVDRTSGQIPYSSFADRHYVSILSALGTTPPTEAGEGNGGVGQERLRLPCEIRLLATPSQACLDLQGVQTTDYERDRWPLYNSTLEWMLAVKREEAAVHDAFLLRMAIHHRQSATDSYWVVWTMDYCLIDYELTELGLTRKDIRLVRDSRMMEALLPDGHQLARLLDEEMEALTTITAYAVRQEAPLSQLDEALDWWQRDWSPQDGASQFQQIMPDLYGAWADVASRMGAMEEPVSDIITRQEEAPELLPAHVELEKPPTGWPENKTGKPFPKSRLGETDERCYHLVLLSGRGRYCEISSDLDRYTATHGPLPTTTGKRTIAGTVLGNRASYPEIQVSVHGSSHFDLPWAISSRAIEKYHLASQVPPRGSPEAVELYHKIVAPQERSAILVDLRYKAAALHGAVEPLPKRGGDWVLSEDNVKRLPEILRKLWISADDLRSRVWADGKARAIRDHWVVLHTGWPELFRPTWPDASAPGFECWLAYALHPYLDEDSANWLIDNEVYGVAMDCAMIDCPAYELPRPESVAGKLAVAAEFLRQCQQARKGMPKLPKYEPAHVTMLLSKRPMLESLVLPSSAVESAFPEYCEHGVYETCLFTMGLGMHQMLDGALAKVLLRVGDESHWADV